MKRVLVTGGAGFIGSHTCKALALSGFQPIVFDDLSNGHPEAVQWGPLVRGDVRDEQAIAEAMAEYRPVAVIHFAGLIEVGRSIQDPAAFWDHNLNGVAAVLRAMSRMGVNRLVFSSTAACYGQPPEGSSTALSEDLPTLPINPYGDSKLAAERLIAASARAYGLEGVALRYFNAAGADPQLELGEAHWPETHLIPLAIEAALGTGKPLTIFGSDFPTPDGTCIRDYIHVEDLARAHVLALDTAAGAERFLAMNLGTGRGSSVKEVVEAVGRAVGRPVPFDVGLRREGDPAILVADPSRARTNLNWGPRFSELDEIIRHAVAWRLAPRFGFDREVAA